ncbi:hydantoinase/oxoprolinase N-terminal domain-containing protein [Streptomyces coeruleorubidus]|uniref:hydantoinase/oxoprolinase N-terminal domain-containing protein n=1 Tax=Streptomyces coeruleorubidus TaxID=116188 RepID=UPI0033D0F178
MTGRQFRVDRGGTFTDIVVPRPDGRPVTHKLLSDSPARNADPAVEGVRTLLGDVLVIESPGGGGYGTPSPDPHQAGEETDDLRAF